MALVPKLGTIALALVYGLAIGSSIAALARQERKKEMLGLRIALFLGFVALGAYMTASKNAAMAKCQESHSYDVCTYSIR